MCQAIEELIKDGEKIDEERGIIHEELQKLVKLVCKKIKKNNSL